MAMSAAGSAQAYLQAQSRWRWPEVAFWMATLLPFAVVPSYLQLASQIAITALFALSLDLILGYAGIVSVGYATSFIVARLRHLALIMITLGMGLLLYEAANSASWLTGGADGLQGVRLWKLFGVFPF